ncbi:MULTISPECIES: hypothetical protein [unclassified Streptomyces]|uniref:hypothetical protein n=1 Tax=unclassified Streptomyces TaxID=2593676 RepID=UPI001E33BC66|nr:hypothetical protein [Streptomyces sp. CB02980]MCB8908344.1 hypothetical protein [Streptomyces sp. CB02980]
MARDPWHPEHHRAFGVRSIDLLDLGFGAGQADLEALDLAEPSFVLGLDDSGMEVVADLDESVPLSWIGAEHRAPDAGFSEPVTTVR